MRFISFDAWRKENADLEEQLKANGFTCYDCDGDGTKECPTCYQHVYCPLCDDTGWIDTPTTADLEHGMKMAYEEQKKADMERWKKFTTAS